MKWCWRKALGLKSPHVAAANEIAPGVVRPSYIFAQMVVKAMFEGDMTKIEEDYSNRHSSAYRAYWKYPFQSASGKDMVIKWSNSTQSKDNRTVWSLTIDNICYMEALDGDLKVVTEALKKVAQLRKKAVENKEIEKRQQLSLDAIELMNDIPKPEKDDE